MKIDCEPGARAHECADMPETGVHITYGDAMRGVRSEAWHLHLVREATEEDLEESHILEEVGETIWSLCAEIRFCPYCASELKTIGDSVPENEEESYGAFSLFDQENWTGRIR